MSDFDPFVDTNNPTNPSEIVRQDEDATEDAVEHTLTPLSKEQYSWGQFNKAAVPGIESQEEPGT